MRQTRSIESFIYHIISFIYHIILANLSSLFFPDLLQLYFFHVPVYAAAVINNNNGTVLATAGPTTVLNRIAAAPTTLSPSGINQQNVQHPLNSMVPSAGGGHQIAPQGLIQALGGANSAQHYGNPGQVPGPHFPPPGSANQIPVHQQTNQFVGNNNQRLTNNAGIGQVPQNQFQGQQRS